MAENTEGKPKILSLDESEVNRQLDRKLIRCTGEEESLKSYFKSIEGQPIDIQYPQNVRVSSNKLNQSIFTYRNAVRRSRASHLEFDPILESLGNKKLYQGVYNINEKETKAEGS